MPQRVLLTDEQYYISDWVGFSFALVSLLLSMLTLYVIYKMCEKPVVHLPAANYSSRASAEMERSKHSEVGNESNLPQGSNKYLKKGTKFNGYLLLIVSMTCCQMFYDFGYILSVSTNYSICVTTYFLTYFGGLSVSIWTNIISFIIYYVVNYVRSVNIFQNFPFFFCVAVGGPFIFAIAQVSVQENFSNTGNGCSATGYSYIFTNIYYWARIVSIVVNAVVFISVSVRLHYLSELPQMRDPSANDSTPALMTLIRRMKYYPLIQVLIRSGAAWNEFNNYQYQTFASQLMNSICSPSSGACYFFLFLYMQPRAYSVFCGTLQRWFCCQSDQQDSVAHDNFILFEDEEDEDLNDLDEDELERLINLNGGNLHRPSDSSSVRFSLSDIFPGSEMTVSVEQ